MSDHTAEVLRQLSETEWDAGFKFLAAMIDPKTGKLIAPLEELRKHNPHRLHSS